ncbi:MAG: hypothetical protein ACOYNZ_02070 [Rhodoferax sp.]
MTNDKSQPSTWERFRSSMWLAESDFDNRERDVAKVELAWAKSALGFRTGKRIGHQGENRARSLLAVSKQTDVFKRRFENGNTLALLQAVELCAEENIPMPAWLATAYIHQLGLFLKPGTCVSLDEVFCSKTLPTETPAKAAAARQDWLIGGQLWAEAWEIAIADNAVTSLDAVLVKVLDKRAFGIGKTKARKLFKMIDSNQAEHTSGKTLSRFLEIRRKQFTPK